MFPDPITTILLIIIYYYNVLIHFFFKPHKFYECRVSIDL